MATVAAAVMSARRGSWQLNRAQDCQRAPLLKRRDSVCGSRHLAEVACEDQRRRRTSQRQSMVIEALVSGQVIALGSRAVGGNGCFASGDVGIAQFDVGGSWVEIIWPNGTRTRTVWPNLSWYIGKPAPANESSHLDVDSWDDEVSTSCGGSSHSSEPY
eukprot:TRINITY_DN57759_c0_g1_i1.p1 TRINITY_DN57759_c0_g1~~TRINITY_DN57759_c0_g1_i1.p1  ORF type:complete len:159 (-),score=13.34 TRINITY_DN57759_c0_g1_i1:41-517(-)